MTSRYFFGVMLVAMSFLAACAGTNFTRLGDSQLHLGADTEAKIRQQLGKPYQEGTVTKFDRQFKTLAYAYSSATGTPAIAGVTPARGQTFYFFERKLVGYEFSSSWAEDSTNFNDWEIKRIKSHQSKVSDVVDLLGEPGGEYIYPLTSEEGIRAKVYKYDQYSGGAFSPRIMAMSLIVSYDENDIVTDVEFTKTGQE